MDSPFVWNRLLIHFEVASCDSMSHEVAMVMNAVGK